MTESVPETSTGLTGVKGGQPVVLQVLPDLNHGGIQRSAIDIAEALAAAGGKAVVAASPGAMIHQLSRAGAVHEQLPLASRNPASIYANIQRIVEVIERHNVDIVHARTRAAGWSALTAAQRTGRRFVTTFHDPYLGASPLQRRYNAVMARGERVIAVSAYVADHVRNTYAIDAPRLRLIRRGVDTDVFSPDKVSNERLIQRVNDWRLPDSLPVVMLPARPERRKGHLLLLEALTELSDLDFVCLLVGAEEARGSLRREIDSLMDRHDLRRRCVLFGHCDDMPAAYKVADVVVSASCEPQAFSRVVAEAQAMGRPVVAADHGGVAEQVVEGHTALLFKPNDAAELVAAIRRALAFSVAERDKLAEEAIDFTRRNFSRREMCQQTLALYDEVLRQPTAATA